METLCSTDARRDAVRATKGRNGLDYIEVDDDQRRLYVYFLGRLPPELARNQPGLERYLSVGGGEAITGLQVLDVDPVPSSDPERDDYLVVTLDRSGDFSPYTLSLNGVEGIDPFYASAEFRFRLCCPSDLDCKPACGCAPPALDEPVVNYLAKDYGSLRQLLLDRLAVLVPGWTERHVPDLGLTLVEVLAYVGDYLSYYQDAVATEAYLGTARQRISVRRHARLVDYVLHEGCNARAFVHLDVSQDLSLPPAQIAFISGANAALPLKQNILDIGQLDGLPAGSYEFFEPIVADSSRPLMLRQAHNRIGFYTWGRRECCLPQGATSATLLDAWLTPPPAGETAAVTAAAPTRALQLQAGDVLIFEEVLGARTGVSADADPTRRWAVRLTAVSADEDPVYPVSVGSGDAAKKMPTPVLRVSWSRADALPFSLCLSSLGAPPNCSYLDEVTVARGNILLVDHGRSQEPEPLGPVPGVPVSSCCQCEGEPADVAGQPGRFRPTLAQSPLSWRQALPAVLPPASETLLQDERKALPVLALVEPDGATWYPVLDLIASQPDDRAFVVETDNAGAAHLRLGDGELGRQPAVGTTFSAQYRVGNGSAGNVGAEAICRLVLKNFSLDGATLTVRNPLPAQGGIDPEPLAQARLLAPGAFRNVLERAITADDYARLAGQDARLQRASAQLNWTGSWYEADVAVDPWGREDAPGTLLHGVQCELEPCRRMGHDLRVEAAEYVPIKLSLQVCALPGYDRGHLKAAILARLSSRRNADGTLGFFHPDQLSFGEGLYLSRVIAAVQALPGVECVTVTEFHRLFALPDNEIADGVLTLAGRQIAQLDNDPNHPEHGQLSVDVRGGR